MSIASTGLSHDERRILRVSAIVAKVGLSRTTIWRLVKAGEFPQPIELATRARGWFDHEIDNYLEARAAERAAGTVAAKHEFGGQAASSTRAGRSASPHTSTTARNTPPSIPDAGEEDDERCDRAGVAAQKQEGGAS
jgi:prophage regulatory protein